jgi:hypothetical protein
MLNKKSFKNKMKQDFSELLKFFESNSEHTNYPGISDKVLTFGEDIKFTKEKKSEKKFSIPYFENSSDISPENFSTWDFKVYRLVIIVISIFRPYIILLAVLLFFFYIRKRYKFIFSSYTFYFIKYVYDLEDLFKFFTDIFK